MQLMNAHKLLTTLVLTAVLVLGSVSGIAFGQVDDKYVENLDGFEDVKESSNITNDKKNKNEIEEKSSPDKIREMKEKRAQKLQDFKIRMSELHHEKIRTNVNKSIRSSEIPSDRQPDVVFEGHTTGWAVIGGSAYRASINFTGEAHHVGNDVLKVKITEGEIKIADRVVKIELKGIAKHNQIVLHGTGELLGGEKVRLFLRGHFAPTTENGLFAIAFTQGAYHNVDTGARIPMAQVGSVLIEQSGDFKLPREMNPSASDKLIG